MAAAATVLAGLLVLLVLIAPIEITRYTPGEFVRLPIEGLLVVALLLLLPPRARRITAAVVGVAFGLLLIIKLLDLGFLAVLARPFDPALDWILFDDAANFLADSIGALGAFATAAALVLLAAGILALMAWAVRRLGAVLARHRPTATPGIAVLTAVWGVCAVFGTQLVPGIPTADNGASILVYDRAVKIRAGLQDQDAFAAEAAVDAFRNTAPDQLLPGLRDKDVVLAFVESYGRSALDDPQMAAHVGATLDAGTAQLNAAGFASRSAFLTSPVAGAGSGLAHATFLSGLWIDNHQRWRNLVSGDRLTLSRAFQRASWRTVGVMPGNTWAWPEGEFYGFDTIYDSRNMGYHGSSYSWATMPDQFTMSAFERLEHGTSGHPPLMTQINLVSSHAPWAPIPVMIDWDAVGDGSIYDTMPQGDPPNVVWADPARVRTEYARSISYSVQSLISYLQQHGDDNTVLIFLGDHQPAPIVTGEGASRDVPITIVARDPAVLDQISGWGWQDGLRPGPQAPVWRMDAFRDRFLTAFGSQADPAGTPVPEAH